MGDDSQKPSSDVTPKDIITAPLNTKIPDESWDLERFRQEYNELNDQHAKVSARYFAAGVGVSTVKDYENGKRKPIGANLAAMKAALEKAGIAFVEGGNGLARGITFATPAADTQS